MNYLTIQTTDLDTFCSIAADLHITFDRVRTTATTVSFIVSSLSVAKYIIQRIPSATVRPI